MISNTTIRWARAADFDQLGAVMFDAVRHGCSLYTEEQRTAWTPEPRSGPEWHARLAAQSVIVRETESQIDGFLSLTETGYVDFAYIRPSAQGTGLFRKLYERIENKARKASAPRLHTHASLMAQPAFSALGFAIIAQEDVELNGHLFKRFEMEKVLAKSPI